MYERFTLIAFPRRILTKHGSPHQIFALFFGFFSQLAEWAKSEVIIVSRVKMDPVRLNEYRGHQSRGSEERREIKSVVF